LVAGAHANDGVAVEFEEPGDFALDRIGRGTGLRLLRGNRGEAED
jgi:hypothetical protein